MTQATTNEWRRSIDPSRTAFFLDVDGTLLGFKDRPEDVVADEALRTILRALSEAASGAVAFVSGRMVADLDRIMAPLVFPAGGTHGADLRHADGRRVAVAGAAIDDLRPLVQAFVDERPGLRLEDKGAALALHYRAAPARAEEVARFLAETVTDDALMIQHGKMVAEVKSSRSDKGTAIAALMEVPPFAGRTPLFVGDDLTDEHGFRAVNARGGLSIKVGHPGEATVATHRLADCAAVLATLAAIAGVGAGADAGAA